MLKKSCFTLNVPRCIAGATEREKERDGRRQVALARTPLPSACFRMREERTVKIVDDFMVCADDASYYQLKPNAGSEKVLEVVRLRLVRRRHAG